MFVLDFYFLLCLLLRSTLPTAEHRIVIFLFIAIFQDPHDELKGKNVPIIRGSEQATAAKLGLSLAVFRESLKSALSVMRKARLLRPPPHLDDKMLAAWNGMYTRRQHANNIFLTALILILSTVFFDSFHLSSERCACVFSSSPCPRSDDIGFRESWSGFFKRRRR